MKFWKTAAQALTMSLFTLLLLAGLFFLVLHSVGFQFYAVKTASMQDVYPIGTLIVVDQTPPEEIETGDVISFVTPSNIVVTHRAIENDFEMQLIYTKGDENNSMDASPVSYDNVLGKVAFGMPFVGNVALFTEKKSVRIVIFMMLVLAGMYLLSGLVMLLAGKIRRRNK